MREPQVLASVFPWHTAGLYGMVVVVMVVVWVVAVVDVFVIEVPVTVVVVVAVMVVVAMVVVIVVAVAVMVEGGRSGTPYVIVNDWPKLSASPLLSV
jgi:hypothetical protein